MERYDLSLKTGRNMISMMEFERLKRREFDRATKVEHTISRYVAIVLGVGRILGYRNGFTLEITEVTGMHKTNGKKKKNGKTEYSQTEKDLALRGIQSYKEGGGSKSSFKKQSSHEPG